MASRMAVGRPGRRRTQKNQYWRSNGKKRKNLKNEKKSTEVKEGRGGQMWDWGKSSSFSNRKV